MTDTKDTAQDFVFADNLEYIKTLETDYKYFYLPNKRENFVDFVDNSSVCLYINKI